MRPVSCKSFVSEGREGGINIFDCSGTSNREFPDLSYRTKITTAGLKKVLLSRKDVVSHFQLHMHRDVSCLQGVSN